MNQISTRKTRIISSTTSSTIALFSVVLAVLCSPQKEVENQNNKILIDSMSERNTVDSNSSSLTSQVITIKNIQNNEQIHEILSIIENYSKEREIKNLKIECFRDSESVMK